MGKSFHSILWKCNEGGIGFMTPQQRFDVVVYRMESAKRLLVEIESHIDDGYYNTAINRMYYACFYAVSALLIHNEIDG